MLLEWMQGDMSVCKVERVSSEMLNLPMTFVARTPEELSLVCLTDNVPDCTTDREDGWRLFRVVGQLEFSLIGILAKITKVLADAGVGVFVISTYDTDYVMIKRENADAAAKALSEQGYQWKN